MTRTRDFVEGTTAFLEKREPVFTGEPLRRPHPISLVVADDLRRWRLSVFFRALLALPHYLVLALWALAVVPVAIVNWAITLAKGRTPDGLHAWNARFLRYWVHVNAYVNLVAEPFPRFRGWLGTYPIDLDVEPPAPQVRWKTALRIVLAIPAYVFAYVLGQVIQVVAFLGWFYALGTSRYPKGFRDLSAYSLRFQAQTYGFLLFLTDRWPSLASSEAPPTSARPRPPAAEEAAPAPPAE
jgi:hypothetical protein